MALFRVSNERAQFDAAGNDARDQYGAGIRFTQGGNARITTGSPTNYNQGIPMSATGQVAIVDATAGLPAGTIFHNGLPISGDKVCVSRNPTAVVSSGLPYDSAGAVAADINLDLNFIGTDTLNSSVTFTRATSATFTGSNGLIQTTPQSKNLLLWTEAFDNAAWVKSAATVTADATTAPDTTTTADKLVETSATSEHYVRTATITLPASGATAVLSVYAKAAERNWIYLANASWGNFAYFDLTTGVVGTTGSSTAGIIPVGNGWYRCYIVFTTNSGGQQFDFRLASANGTTTYAGNGTNGAFIWGAQLELNASVTSYTRNDGGLFPPRFDYDPVTLAAKGLLIEEQRTNLLTYSEQFDNAAWTKVAGSVSVSQNAVGPNGVSNSGATVTALAGTNNHWLYQSFASTAIAYSQSVYAKAGTASWIGIGFGAGATTDGVFFNLSSGTVGTAAFGSTGNIQNVGNGWYRCTVTRTGPGGTYFGALEVHTADNQALNWNAAGTETILVFGLNMEAGSFATSYIPTVASQVTRSADVASVNTLSPWYNATEGTLYAEYSHATTSTNNPAAVSINANTNAEQIIIYGETTIGEKFFVRDGGVIQANITASAKFASGVTGKLAGAYKVNDFAASANGAAAVVDTSGSIPTVTQMNIGNEYNGTLPLNGHIRRITYYPRRLSNAELQAITT